jgi:hypothetical protein
LMTASYCERKPQTDEKSQSRNDKQYPQSSLSVISTPWGGETNNCLTHDPHKSYVSAATIAIPPLAMPCSDDFHLSFSEKIIIPEHFGFLLFQFNLHENYNEQNRSREHTSSGRYTVFHRSIISLDLPFRKESNV